MIAAPRRVLLLASAPVVLTSCGSSSDRAMRLGNATTTSPRVHAAISLTAKATAQVYPNLAQNPIVRSEDPDAVIEIVLHGRGGMP